MKLQLILLVYLFSELRAVPLLMSWSSSIKLFDDRDTNNVTSVTPSTRLAIGVDYHYKRGEIYFSDGLGRIYRGWLRDKREPIVIVEVKLADGLAVDWINDNLYWTDITRQTIEMSTLDGLYRRVLFNAKNDTVEKPRAIVLDPSEGVLFWSDWGSKPRVESSGLDGKNKKTILSSDIIWPNGLALDLVHQKVYILDGLLSRITSCNYDGSGLQIIFRSQEKMTQAFGLSFYANKLYWSSWRAHTLFSMQLPNGDPKSVLELTGLRGIMERMMGVKVMHPSLQRVTTMQNPCESAGCSHKCLTGRGHIATCICPFGFNLASDGKTCLEEGYLLVSWRKTIRRYTLNGTQEEPMNDDAKAAVSLAYHFKKQLVFWSDIEEHRIYRAPLGQLNNKTVVATTETCDGLAVDWVHDVLYWTDTAHNTLEAALLDGSKHTIIFSENLDQPRDIALDPLSGYMFWTDWGANPKIERAVLDGSSRQTIVSNNVSWPNGITIDFNKKRIYWVDGKLSTISSSLYDGSQRKTHFEILLSFLLQPFSISLYQDYIYWTDWKSQAIYKAVKNDIDELEKLANTSSILLRPNGVKVVHSALQRTQENPCASLRCQDLCLGSTTPQGAHCIGKQITEPDIDFRNGGDAEKVPFTAEALNDTIQLSLNTSISPALTVITIKCVKRNGCEDDKRCSGASPSIKVFNNQKIFSIGGLLPATLYEIDFQSEERHDNVQLVTSITDPPEVPELQSVAVSGRNVTIKWKPVDSCVPNFPGYHYKLFKTKVTNDVALEGLTNLTEVTIENLEPEVGFTVEIYTYDPKYFSKISFETEVDETSQCQRTALICDGKDDCSDGSDEKLELCAGIQNVIVYKKSISEVYLRCQVSDRTKKQLNKFVGNYSYPGSTKIELFEQLAVPCTMWPESFCFNVSSLSGNKRYSFSVAAALKGGRVGNPFTFSVITKEGVSGPPEDVQVVTYTATSAVIQWHHPNQSNGIIRNFVVNIQEIETFEPSACCQSFPIIESPVKSEEHVYTIEVGGLLPASTYAVSITAKTIYVGGSTAIEVHTPPEPMKIIKQPNILVSSLQPLSWKKENNIVDNPQYRDLITSYILLMLPSANEDQELVKNTELGSLNSVLDSQLGEGYNVLWHKNASDTSAFQKPIVIKDLHHRKQYKLAWVQVSQYKEVYGVDYIISDPFIFI